MREGGRGERVRAGGMEGEGRREREGARSIDRTNRVCALDAEGRDGAVCRASDAPEAAPGRGTGTGTCPRAWTSSSRGSAAMRNRRGGRGVSVARGGRGRRRGGGFRVGARLARDGSIARETREVFSRRATPPGARRTHPNVEEGDGGGGEAEGGPQQTFPTNDGHARGATGACGREGGSAEDARGFRISTRPSKRGACPGSADA